MISVQEYKETVLKSLEEDSVVQGEQFLRYAKNQRGGKFKLSERQYIDQIAAAWCAAEFSAVERVLRVIEADSELTTRDLIRGELHMMLIRMGKSVKKHPMFDRTKFDLEDILDGGKFSTTKVLEHYTGSPTGHAEAN